VHHIEFIQQEASNTVTIQIYLLAFWVLEPECNMDLLHWITFNVFFFFFENLLDG
jgi:hypothetical protein